MGDTGTDEICDKNDVSAMYDTTAYKFPMQQKKKKKILHL